MDGCYLRSCLILAKTSVYLQYATCIPGKHCLFAPGMAGRGTQFQRFPWMSGFWVFTQLTQLNRWL